MGTVVSSARSIWGDTRSRRRILLVTVVALFCYAIILIVPHFSPNEKPFPRTFNSMLDHLLRGRVDVDPGIVGLEGFLRNGRVYAYWGVLPAILRLPVTILPQWRDLNFTIAYCIVALILMGATKIWTVRFVLRHHPGIPRPVARAMYSVIAFSGAQMCFIKPSLFQEICLWAGLFGAIFVAAAIVAQHRGLGGRERLMMAVAAGAALLTRVSTGIGLIAAFSFLLLVDGVIHRADWRRRAAKSALPLFLLAVAGLATGWINHGRWGHPLVFADYQYYLFNIQFPDRVPRTALYGLFNIERIPFGIIYYFFPIWVLHGSDGHLLFDAARSRLIDSAELPPSSFLLTDPLLLLLGGMAVVGWLAGRSPGAAQARAIAAGLAIPPMLMLTAITMAFRYRVDFYPLIEFLAFSGFAMMDQSSLSMRPRLIWTLAAASIASSITVGALYMASRFGPGELLIGGGIRAFYLGRLGIA